MIDILITPLAWDDEMTGPNIRVFSIAKYLARMGKKTIVTLINYQQSKMVNGYKILGISCLPLFSSEKIKKIKGLTFVTTLFAEISYSLHVCRLIKRFKPKILLVEETHALATPLLIGLKFFCKLYGRQVTIVLDKHNVIYDLVCGFRNLYYNKNLLILGSIPLIYFLEKLEVMLPEKIIVVSKTDEKLINKLYKRKKDVFVIPNGVDLEKFKPNKKEGLNLKRERGLLNKKIILFLGGLNYLPNFDAVEVFVNKILPRIKEKIPNVMFVVVGKCPIKIFKKYEKNRSVIFTDFVKNEVPYINSADICVAPLRTGGGTRLKILSYMACGKVVVSTPKGAEGLEVENYKDIIIAKLEEFSDIITCLLKNSAIRNKIGHNARRKVSLMYSWEGLTKKLWNKLIEVT
jgi:glycosyltransferase involved in cell wall biosynthesis